MRLDLLAGALAIVFALSVWQRHRLWFRRTVLLCLMGPLLSVFLFGFGQIGRMATDRAVQERFRGKEADDYMAGLHAAQSFATAFAWGSAGLYACVGLLAWLPVRRKE